MANETPDQVRASSNRRRGAAHAASLIEANSLRMEYALAEAQRRRLIKDREASAKWNWLKRGVGGGLTGAAAGSSFGPWGALIGGVAGFGVGAASSALDAPGETTSYDLASSGMQAVGLAGNAMNAGGAGAKWVGSGDGSSGSGRPSYGAGGLALPGAGTPAYRRPEASLSAPLGTYGSGNALAQNTQQFAPTGRMESSLSVGGQRDAAPGMTQQDLAMLMRQRRGLGLPEYDQGYV